LITTYACDRASPSPESYLHVRERKGVRVREGSSGEERGTRLAVVHRALVEVG
jgi:hypothetical protein